MHRSGQAAKVYRSLELTVNEIAPGVARRRRQRAKEAKVTHVGFGKSPRKFDLALSERKLICRLYAARNLNQGVCNPTRISELRWIFVYERKLKVAADADLMEMSKSTISSERCPPPWIRMSLFRWKVKTELLIR